MRVLMISPQFRPLVGGYERAAERLSAALAAAGCASSSSPSAATARGRRWNASMATRCGGCPVRIVVTSTPSPACFRSPAFCCATAANSMSGMCINMAIHAALAVALGKALRRPVVLKLTNSGAMGIAVTLGSGIVGRILGFFHRRVSACLAVTEETRAEAIRFGIPARTYPPYPERRGWPAVSPRLAGRAHRGPAGAGAGLQDAGALRRPPLAGKEPSRSAGRLGGRRYARRERARYWHWWAMGRTGIKFTPRRRRQIWRAASIWRASAATWRPGIGRRMSM